MDIHEQMYPNRHNRIDEPQEKQISKPLHLNEQSTVTDTQNVYDKLEDEVHNE